MPRDTGSRRATAESSHSAPRHTSVARTRLAFAHRSSTSLALRLGVAIGSSRPTAGSSASATRSSTAPRRSSISASPSPPWPRAIAGTGSSARTAGSSRSATRTTRVERAISRFPAASSTSHRRRRDAATSCCPTTVASSRSVMRPSAGAHAASSTVQSGSPALPSRTDMRRPHAVILTAALLFGSTACGTAGTAESTSAQARRSPSTTTAPATARATTTAPTTPPKAPPAPAKPDLCPYRDLGVWVDVYDYVPAFAENGQVAPVTPAAVDTMRAHGVHTLYLQVAKDDPRSPGTITDPPKAAEFLQRAHAAGIKVVAWYLPTHRDPNLDKARVL